MEVRAFTLAEVLITLVIIGVVASLTIPTLVSNYTERQTVTKLKQVYSILYQATEIAQVKYGEINDWEPIENAYSKDTQLFSRLAENIKFSIDCGNNTRFCSISNVRYSTLKGQNTLPVPVSTAHSGILENGVAITIANTRTDSGKWWGRNASIYIDLNGPNKLPNIHGKDVFLFEIRDQTSNWDKSGKSYLYPGGWFVSASGEECLTYANGLSCAEWVIRHNNMDYLHCPDKLGYNGPYSCSK